MLQIDTEDLIMAMESNNLNGAWYLNTETGGFVYYSEMGDPPPDWDEIEAEMDEHPEKWELVEAATSSEAFAIMEEFTDELPDGEDKRTLKRALTWKKPFSNFRDALLEMPDIRDKWFAYRDTRALEAAKEWLASKGIQAELVGRKPQ